MNKHRFLLLVTSAPYQNQNSYSAYQFAKALLKQKHDLEGVFFYDEGVMHSNALLAKSEEEISMLQNWQELSDKYQIPLLICSSDAIRRGLFSAIESNPQLAAGFTASSLGQLFMLMKNCDRFVTF